MSLFEQQINSGVLLSVYFFKKSSKPTLVPFYDIMFLSKILAIYSTKGQYIMNGWELRVLI